MKWSHQVVKFKKFIQAIWIRKSLIPILYSKITYVAYLFIKINFRWDLKKKRLEIDYHLNSAVRGMYTAGGRVLILPITGDGVMKLRLSEYILFRRWTFTAELPLNTNYCVQSAIVIKFYCWKVSFCAEPFFYRKTALCVRHWWCNAMFRVWQSIGRFSGAANGKESR